MLLIMVIGSLILAASIVRRILDVRRFLVFGSGFNHSRTRRRALDANLQPVRSKSTRFFGQASNTLDSI